jgi:hypothetical protein
MGDPHRGLVKGPPKGGYPLRGIHWMTNLWHVFFVCNVKYFEYRPEERISLVKGLMLH